MKYKSPRLHFKGHQSLTLESLHLRVYLHQSMRKPSTCPLPYHQEAAILVFLTFELAIIAMLVLGSLVKGATKHYHNSTRKMGEQQRGADRTAGQQEKTVCEQEGDISLTNLSDPIVQYQYHSMHSSALVHLDRNRLYTNSAISVQSP
jgi:hypothetical protein